MYDSESERVRRRRWGWAGWAIFLGLVGTLFVLNCSGINFPIWGPQDDLDGRLRTDFGIGLPPGAVVEHGVRVATRDPARLYVVSMPPERVAGFVGDLRKAARRRWAVDEPSQGDRRFSFGCTVPEWFDPGRHADVERLWVRSERGSGPAGPSYWWAYSISAGRVYLFWWSP